MDLIELIGLILIKECILILGCICIILLMFYIYTGISILLKIFEEQDLSKININDETYKSEPSIKKNSPLQD